MFLNETDKKTINELDKSIGQVKKKLGSKSGALTKSGKTKDEKIKFKKIIKRDQELLSLYRERIKIIPEVLKTKVAGTWVRKYKQLRRNAYKINGGQYGGLLINVPRLMGEMVIEAHKGGKVVYENKADKSLIDLLTKRFDPKKRYSSIAKQVFNDLNLLSGIPKHISSGKTNLIGGAMYYTNPSQLLKRLKLVTGARRAGNNSIKLVNETWEIIDALIRDGVIDQDQYDAYVGKYLI